MKNQYNMKNKLYTILILATTIDVYPSSSQSTPGFDCSAQNISPVEKMICENHHGTAKYDRVMNYIYHLLMLHLADKEKNELKNDQNKWLKEGRKKAFNEEFEIRKDDTFANSTHPLKYADRLLLGYGERLRFLCTKYDNELKEILFSKLDAMTTQDELDSSLHLIFCTWMYFHINPIADPTIRHPMIYGLSIEDDRLLRQSDGAWLLLWKGNSCFQCLNRDGGVYSFKLILPKERQIVNISDGIQAYLYKIEGNKIVLANGGWGEKELDGSPRNPDKLTTYTLQRDPLSMIELTSTNSLK